MSRPEDYKNSTLWDVYRECRMSTYVSIDNKYVGLHKNISPNPDEFKIRMGAPFNSIEIKYSNNNNKMPSLVEFRRPLCSLHFHGYQISHKTEFNHSKELSNNILTAMELKFFEELDFKNFSGYTDDESVNIALFESLKQLAIAIRDVDENKLPEKGQLDDIMEYIKAEETAKKLKSI